MSEKIELFRMAAALARHAGARQAVVAQNIANADTPGYKARDIVPFAELMRQDGAAFHTRATRASHLHGAREPRGAAMIAVADAISNPNENEVSLEDEMLKAVDVKRQHDKALAIYRSGLTILRSSLGRR